MAKVKICETVLRDSHQSLVATRMTTEEMLPILKALDEVGYHSLEAWGGATFDSCLRFLNEDPWQRLRVIRDNVKNTKLQMLFRGQNILGYRHYADDVVEYFVQKSIANGIDIIRIFDALNDERNLRTAINATKKEKGHVQVAFSYTTGPCYTTEYFVDYTKRLVDMGVDSICIKDMAGLLKPYAAEELVKALKTEIPNLPVELHTHYTAGLASMTALKAIEAGCDIIDTAISPLALGTSQPPTEPIVAALQGTPYDTGLDLEKLNVVGKHFEVLREKYLENGLLNPKVLKVDVNALLYQVPGGMLSNLISQLKNLGKSDKLTEVLEEVPRVRADAGYPPLVTPSSQIVGTQAVFNVINGRYKTVTKEFKGLIRGEYGQAPMEIDPEFRKQIIGNEEPITCRPADNIAPELENLKKKAADYIQQDEDVLSYALFEQVAEKFFEKRRETQLALDSENADPDAKIHSV
ncbi:MAG: oxaloacetate decarboxylase subunit alpha [Clostridia bacterium]|nr:oxaloacetate decarboxylase subunit alpha [Clostridia bacterium]